MSSYSGCPATETCEEGAGAGENFLLHSPAHGLLGARRGTTVSDTLELQMPRSRLAVPERSRFTPY